MHVKLLLRNCYIFLLAQILFIPIILDLHQLVDSTLNIQDKNSRATRFHASDVKYGTDSQNISERKNKTAFKKCLQQTLLQLLEHEENYVDVHTLIQKIPSFRSITTNSN